MLIPTQIKSLRQYFYPCLGGILGGIFTPTEASAVAAAYAFFIGLFVWM